MSNRRFKKSIRIGFSLCLSIVIFLVLIFISYCFINKSIKIQDEEKLSYTEKSDIDYKVKLKPNTFYQNEYIDKNMSYIANLIDLVNIKFNYNFNADNQLNGKYNYRIIGRVDIRNSDTKELFFSKDYILLEEKSVNFRNRNNFNINESIDINYDYYNNLANSFKSEYGVSSTSDLNVYMEITRDIDDTLVQNNELDNTSKMSIDIPLSQKAISITMDYKNINNKDTVLTKRSVSLNDKIFFSIGILLLLVSIIVFIGFIVKIDKISIKLSPYDKRIKKILREYDRLIVNTEVIPEFDDYDVIKLKEFNELLDAKDNLHRPIYYVDIEPHSKCCFYIKDEDELIVYMIEDTSE